MSEKQSCVEVVRFIGVDVSKEKLDVCVMPGGELHDFQNDAEGIEKLVALFKQLRPVAIVLEATGGYERPPLFAMQDAGLPVTLVNPRQVRDFARGARPARENGSLGCRGLGRVCPPGGTGSQRKNLGKTAGT